MGLIQHMHSPLFLCLGKLQKILVQLPRNIEDHEIAHFTLCFAFFFILQSILYGESPWNWWFFHCPEEMTFTDISMNFPDYYQEEF